MPKKIISWVPHIDDIIMSALKLLMFSILLFYLHMRDKMLKANLFFLKMNVKLFNIKLR